jgi:two-component system, cell cycle response regulator
LLDLSLPDSQGLDTFLRLHTQAPNVPVVILAGVKDEALGRIAVREGAQDYVVKGQVSGRQLARTISYAVTRQSLQAEFRAQSLLDDLTGLYNRRGFLTLAEQHWKLAYRTNRAFLLIYADMDGLKKINDHFGHRVGDAALRQAAKIIRQTFRDSDVLARLGGDEFVILVTEAPPDGGEALTTRLQRSFKNYNRRETTSFELSFSIGAAAFDPAEPVALEALLGSADQAMCANRLSKRKEQA